MKEKYLDLTDFALVNGPLNLREPAYSFNDNGELLLYTPDEIKAAILSIPNTKVRQQPTGYKRWEAAWNDGDRYIVIDVLECDLDWDDELRPDIDVYWGGSFLRTHCFLDDLLMVWNSIRTVCPAVWLHDTDCRLYSPVSFAREIQDQSS